MDDLMIYLRDSDGCAISSKVFQCVLNLLLSMRVQGGCGLVQQHYLRLFQNSTGYGNL
jgi:hypothetical protein